MLDPSVWRFKSKPCNVASKNSFNFIQKAWEFSHAWEIWRCYSLNDILHSHCSSILLKVLLFFLTFLHSIQSEIPLITHTHYNWHSSKPFNSWLLLKSKLNWHSLSAPVHFIHFPTPHNPSSLSIFQLLETIFPPSHDFEYIDCSAWNDLHFSLILLFHSKIYFA